MGRQWAWFPKSGTLGNFGLWLCWFCTRDWLYSLAFYLFLRVCAPPVTTPFSQIKRQVVLLQVPYRRLSGIRSHSSSHRCVHRVEQVVHWVDFRAVFFAYIASSVSLVSRKCCQNVSNFSERLWHRSKKYDERFDTFSTIVICARYRHLRSLSSFARELSSTDNKLTMFWQYDVKLLSIDDILTINWRHFDDKLTIFWR